MRPKRARYVVMALIIIGIFSIISLKMYDLQILAYEDYQQAASTKTTRTITLTGRRGTIYDANMIPLAYDKPAFDVQFYRDPSATGEEDRAAYTQSIIDTIALIERGGKRTVNEFWLKKGEDGVWRFDTGTDNPTVAAKREKQWRQNFYLDKEPEEALFDRLCENYKIPKDMDDEMKVKVLSIWQLSRMYNFLSMPVVIANDVGFDTVSELETRSLELIGMSVKQSSVRVYPKGQTAAHVVGYISKISGEETLANYKEKGYSNDATMGQTGIEYSMEDQLTPYMEYRKGQRVVEINNRGKVIREISYQAPIDGNSIVLTLESKLQQVTESALYKAIEGINKIQMGMLNSSEWRKDNQEELLRYESLGKQVEIATSGAIVVMAPDSGRVMAMASYPTMDLSRFTGGQVAPEYWNELVNNPDNPLYNRAISARDTPGSCFKMVTALAGLVEGKLTLDERITDRSPFTETDDKSHTPSCWISKANRYKHADQTVVEGLKNSCNYFFFTVGLRLGVDNIVKWAANLGLTSRTGIELPNESTSFVGDQSKLYDPDRPIDGQYTGKPYFAARAIKNRLRKAGEDRGIEYDEDRLNKATKMILDVASDEGNKSTWLRKIQKVLLEEMNLPADYISRHTMVSEFVTYINDLRWTPNETIMEAIGQSITQITPIAAARYVSAICNGGTVYDAQIIDKIVSPTGKVVLEKQPVVANYISGADAYLAAIQEGMEDVTSTENDGTAAEVFKGSHVKIAAKTGTAQRSKIDVENNAWLVAYGDYEAERPTIVVVVYIQNGLGGARAGKAAREIIEYYIADQKKVDSLTVPTSNTIAK